MFHILKACTGSRFCPWCKYRSLTWWERNIVDRYPIWYVKFLIMTGYDRYVGIIGMWICNNFHWQEEK